MTDLITLLGDGSGSFYGAPVTRSPNARGIVTADFNGDGKPDVAVANMPCSACNATVTVLLGTGKDWFKAPRLSPTGFEGVHLSPRMGMAAGDLNGDGRQDLVLSNENVGAVSILLGNGDGTFRPGRMLPVTASRDVEVADINNDGKLDIVVGSGVLLGRGDGTFGPLIPFPDFGFPVSDIKSIAVADLNGDGKLDVAAGSVEEPGSPGEVPVYDVTVLWGKGNGNFDWDELIGVPNFRSGLVAAKMTGQALPDLVVAGAGISILANDGQGIFTENLITYAGSNSDYIAVGDFTGDGTNDVKWERGTAP